MLEISPRNLRTWSMLGPCGAFGLAIQDLADSGTDLAVVTADLRFYSGLDRFALSHPNDCYNVGIAEQNLVGVAAGMAKEGSLVYATTYATFASTRCLDQVRVNMSYMKLPVKLVGLTSGLSVGILGATHMSCEDLAIMRALPNIMVLSPADGLEVIKATQAAATIEAPVYLRLPGGINTPLVYKEDYDFVVGKAVQLRAGTEICLVATGAMVAVAVSAAEQLESELGFEVGVLNMHTLKPFDENAIQDLQNAGCELFVSLEEHSIIGGLGSALAEVLATKNNGKVSPLLTLGIRDTFPKAAPYDRLLEECGLTSEQVCVNIKERWAGLQDAQPE